MIFFEISPFHKNQAILRHNYVKTTSRTSGQTLWMTLFRDKTHKNRPFDCHDMFLAS